MGVVYKAEDVNLGREAALKFLAREALGDAEHRERFLGEALLRSPWRCGLCAVAGQALGHRRSFFNPQLECDRGGLRSLSVRLPRAAGLVLGYLGD